MTLLTRLALRHPVRVSAALALVTAILGLGVARLETQVGYRGFLGDRHPAIVELDALVERFGGGLPAAVLWSCAENPHCEDVFDPASLRMARELARRLEAEPGVRRVASPATAPLLVVTRQGLAALRPGEEPLDAATRRALLERARIDPLWRGWLISPDGRVGALVVEHASSDSRAARHLVHTLDDALRPFEAEGWRFHRVGPVVELVQAEQALAADTFRVVPLMAALVLGVFWLAFRSGRAALLALITAGAAPVWALGLSGWLGWPRNAVMQALPPVLLVIATAHAVHWLARYASLRLPAGAGRRTREEALLRVSRDIGAPCFMTAATTAAGFLSFLMSGVESFARFGSIAAAGVGAALLLSFTGLPLGLLRLPPDSLRGARASLAWDRGLERLARWTERRRGTILAVSAALALLAALGLTRLRVDVHPYELVGSESPVVRDARFLEQHLRKPDALELEVGLPPGAQLHDPEVLRAIDRVARAVTSVEGLGPARSVLDALRYAHRLIHGDAPEAERIPEQAATNAELLLLLSLQARELLTPWVSLDRRRVRISVEAPMESQRQHERRLAEVQARLARVQPAGFEIRLGGPLWVRHTLVGEIQRAQLRSFASAGVAVLLLLWGFLGSATWAGLALLPSALPVLVTLGSMGILGATLDIGGAMVAAVVLGIAVDDTIYLLSRYQRQRRQGLTPAASIRGAVLHVGRAITTTSVALGLGFGALGLSQLQSIAQFGLLAGIAILAAWVADVLLLPALISGLGAREAPGSDAAGDLLGRLEPLEPPAGGSDVAPAIDIEDDAGQRTGGKLGDG